jgi:hypothetical protein
MHIGCGSSAYSVGTVYGGKGHLYTPGARPVSLATPRRFTGDCPARPVGSTLLTRLTGTRPIRKKADQYVARSPRIDQRDGRQLALIDVLLWLHSSSPSWWPNESP